MFKPEYRRKYTHRRSRVVDGPSDGLWVQLLVVPGVEGGPVTPCLQLPTGTVSFGLWGWTPFSSPTLC